MKKSYPLLLFLLLILVTTIASPLAYLQIQKPVRLDLIGAMSGRTADLGISAHNGARLAVDQYNANLSFGDPEVELVVHDHLNDPMVAVKQVESAIHSGTAAIIGPVYSQYALPIANAATRHRTVVMGITITTDQLTGVDDHFFRTLAASRSHAMRSAEFHYNNGLQRVAVAYDSDNRAYTEGWLKNFRERFESLGGELISLHPFASSRETQYTSLVESILNRQPDGVLMICSAVDAALLAQLIRKQDRLLPLIGAEWAGTKRLLDLGGEAVEGFTVSHYYDQHSDRPDYRAFARQYERRFAHPPGFAAVVAYNSVQTVLKAIDQQRPGEMLKTTLLRIGRFEGLQEPIQFNAFGDVESRTYFSRVSDGKFQLLN